MPNDIFESGNVILSFGKTLIEIFSFEQAQNNNNNININNNQNNNNKKKKKKYEIPLNNNKIMKLIMTTTKFYVYIFIRIMSYVDIVPVLFQYGLQHLVYISKKKANLNQVIVLLIKFFLRNLKMEKTIYYLVVLIILLK